MTDRDHDPRRTASGESPRPRESGRNNPPPPGASGASDVAKPLQVSREESEHGQASEPGSPSATASAQASRSTAQEREVIRSQSMALIEQAARLTTDLGGLGARIASPEEMANAVVDRCLNVFGAQAVAAFNVSPDGGTLELLGATGIASDVRRTWERIPVASSHPVAAAFAQGALVTAESSGTVREQHPETAAQLDQLQCKSLVVIPVSYLGRRWGVLALALPQPRKLERHERALLGTLGMRYAQALYRSRLYLAEAHARREIEAARSAAESARAEADRQRTAAEEASKAKSDFLAVMSHELRTPLQAILGFSDLLRSGVPHAVPDHVVRQAQRIYEASEHLLTLVEQLLSFSRLEAGRNVVRRELVDLGRMCREVLVLGESLARGKGLMFHCNLSPDSPIMITTDAGKLRQVLYNLVSNAVKFTDQGAVTVDIRRVESGVVIEVCDTGIGISPDQLDRAFTPFWRANQSAGTGRGGTGLGLSIVQRLVGLLGGTVAVRSTPGVGTTVTVNLPREIPEPTSVEA